jgi:hypothetical protein
MTPKPKSQSHASAAAVLSAGFLLLPGSAASAQGTAKAAPPAQKGAAERGSIHIKFATTFHKYGKDLRVAGTLKGSPVFKTAQGEFFTVEPNTGDLKFHTAESLGFIKIGDIKGRAASPKSTDIFIKFDGIKGEQRVSVAGVDDQGNVIQENSRGERFYLGRNGDMVFVK